MDASVETFLPELDERATRILQLIRRIIELLSVDVLVLLKDEISAKWESDYRCRDLSEQVTKLKKELREIRLGSVANMEAAHDDEIRALEARIGELEARIVELESEPRRVTDKERLTKALSKNWELGYQCRDLSGEVWRLKQQLRRRIALGDMESLPFKPKTGLERALQKRIDELEGRGKHPRRKARSRSI